MVCRYINYIIYKNNEVILVEEEKNKYLLD